MRAKGSRTGSNPASKKKKKKNIRRIQCYKCGEFINSPGMARHMKRQHSEEGKKKRHSRKGSTDFPCDVEECGHISKCRSSYKSHKKKHEGTYEVTCDICQRKYVHNYLARHKLKKHSKGDTFPCDFEGCQDVFPSRKELGDHKNAVHWNYRPHACVFCDKRFKSASLLKAHHGGVHGQEFISNYAQISSKGNEVLPLLRTTEETRIAQTLRIFKCQFCQRDFTALGRLNKHKKEACKMIPRDGKIKPPTTKRTPMNIDD